MESNTLVNEEVKKKKPAKKKKKKASGVSKGRSDDIDMKEAQEWLDALKVQDVISPEFLKENYLLSAARDFRNKAPFPYHRMKNFMDDAFLRRLREELEHIEYYQKHNDLYEFHQSYDLKGIDSPLVKKVKEVLYSDEFRTALSTISGIQLDGLADSVDMSCAVYQSTHRLLCHDDELAGRRIAYILYLVPSDWTAFDGGALDLFSVGADGEPTSVHTSLVPEWNSFVFFEVSPVSYHQVSEVLVDKTRVSISGWFHGAPIERVHRAIDPEVPFVVLCPGSNLDDWVSREYRKPALLKKINKRFGEDSSLELQNYLRKDKYAELMSELDTECWTSCGPANKRHYGQLAEPRSAIIKSFKAFTASQEFANHLSEITGLELLSARGELRRMAKGDYSLAYTTNPDNARESLDVLFTFISPKMKWESIHGASLHYLPIDQDGELLTVDPSPNTLALVYVAEEGALRFVHYVNHTAPGHMYQSFTMFRTNTETNGEGDDEGEESDEEEKADKALASPLGIV